MNRLGFIRTVALAALLIGCSTHHQPEWWEGCTVNVRDNYTRTYFADSTEIKVGPDMTSFMGTAVVVGAMYNHPPGLTVVYDGTVSFSGPCVFKEVE